AHAMAQALGGTYGLPHGAMNALCLPPGVRFAAAQTPDAVRRFERAPVATTVDALAALGGFGRLRDFGLLEEDVTRFATAARARAAVAAKGSIQSCNSAKAQGGIQAAFGEDDSPEQHADDVWRSSHETADMRLVGVLTSEAPGAIHWLEQLGVAFTRENGGYR